MLAMIDALAFLGWPWTALQRLTGGDLNPGLSSSIPVKRSIVPSSVEGT